MKFAVFLSERSTSDLIKSALALGRTFEEMLQGPSMIFELLRNMNKVNGKIALMEEDEGRPRVIRPIPLPSLEEFRRRPGVRVLEGEPPESLRLPFEGTLAQVDYPGEQLREMVHLVQSESPLEAYSYALWLYLALMRETRTDKRIRVGVFSPKEDRFYSV